MEEEEEDGYEDGEEWEWDILKGEAHHGQEDTKSSKKIWQFGKGNQTDFIQNRQDPLCWFLNWRRSKEGANLFFKESFGLTLLVKIWLKVTIGYAFSRYLKVTVQ